ncbi:hypothetical protein BS47DRAFT_1400362 [Hydnum rufescens UP504]|uniref:Uncharacterized protein n=1 Tax=Hydnum rufescens UP504 TaxID=1448309 RepID=A0A9P6AGT8_9AGAM|nr:hypothetical protein BS47DRAFT_1400362 [Hydnum rufescens UP504]
MTHIEIVTIIERHVTRFDLGAIRVAVQVCIGYTSWIYVDRRIDCELKTELLSLSLRVQKIASPSASKLSQISTVRKSIARVLTVTNQKARQNLREYYKNKKYLPLDGPARKENPCHPPSIDKALSLGIVIVKSVDGHSTQSACPRLTRSSSTDRVIARERTFYPVWVYATRFDSTDYCSRIGSTVLIGVTLVALVKSVNKHSTQSACSVTPLLVALSPGIVIVKSVDGHSTQSACPRLTRSSSTATVRVIARERTFYPVSTRFDITDYCPRIGSTVLAGVTLVVLVKSVNKHSTQSACSVFRRFMRVTLDYLPGSYYW